MSSRDIFHTDEMQRRNLCKKCKKRTKFSKGSAAWRFLKGTIFFLCLTLFFYQSANFLVVYYRYPTTTKIEFTYPDEIELPAVTFCSGNPIKRSKFCATYPNLCGKPANITTFCKQFSFVCVDNPTNLFILNSELPDSLSSKQEFAHAINNIYYGGNITKEFWEEWSWSIETFDTMWKIRNIKLLFVADTEYQTTSTFRYELNIQRGEQLDFSIEPTVFISVHSPYDPVNPFAEGKRLNTGCKHSVFIKLEEEHKLPSPYETNCTNYIDLWSKNNRQGPRSQQMCKDFCQIHLLQTNNSMKPEFEILEYPLKFCIVGKECEISPEDRENLEHCRRDCKPNCRNLKYSITRIQTEKDNYKLENHECVSDRDTTEVEIYLGDRQVVVEQHLPVYDTGYLFSYIGGLMGCWLGISIWAFAGIAENVFRKSTQWMRKIKRHFKETFPAQNTNF